jgi:hypothetical protein
VGKNNLPQSRNGEKQTSKRYLGFDKFAPKKLCCFLPQNLTGKKELNTKQPSFEISSKRKRLKKLG